MTRQIEIGPAWPQEAPAIAGFHVAVWRETYRDIAPAAAYDALDTARRLPHWQDLLARPGAAEATLIARSGAGIAGLMNCGAPQHPIFGTRGEIRHLYVDTQCRGTGLGRRLLIAAARHLQAASFPDMALAVVEQNLPARGFYAALGGIEAGRFQDPGPLWRSDNILIAFSLEALLAQAEA